MLKAFAQSIRSILAAAGTVSAAAGRRRPQLVLGTVLLMSSCVFTVLGLGLFALVFVPSATALIVSSSLRRSIA